MFSRFWKWILNTSPSRKVDNAIHLSMFHFLLGAYVGRSVKCVFGSRPKDTNTRCYGKYRTHDHSVHINFDLPVQTTFPRHLLTMVHFWRCGRCGKNLPSGFRKEITFLAVVYVWHSCAPIERKRCGHLKKMKFKETFSWSDHHSATSPVKLSQIFVASVHRNWVQSQEAENNSESKLHAFHFACYDASRLFEQWGIEGSFLKQSRNMKHTSRLRI